MSKPASNSNRKNRQTIPKQTIKIISKELSSLKSIIKSKDNPQQLSKQISDAICLMEKRLGFHFSDKTEQDFQDYIQQFYQLKINTYQDQLTKLKLQNQKFRTTIKQLQPCFQSQDLREGLQGKSQVNKQYFQTCTSQFNRIAEMTKIRQQLDHCNQIVKQNQSFIMEQNEVIHQLRQQLLKTQRKNAQLRLKHQEKVKDLDFFVNKQESNFKNRLKQFQIETNSVYKQIGVLQKRNIKNIQEKCRLDQQVGSVCEQLKREKDANHQLQLLLQQKEQQLKEFQRVFYANQSIAKISQAQSKAYLQKIEFLNQQWEIKLENKKQQIRMLQDKLSQSQQQANKKECQLQRISNRLKSLQQQNKQMQQNKQVYESKKDSIEQDLTSYTNQIYEMNQQLKNCKAKQQEYERLLSQGYEKIKNHDKELDMKDQQLHQIIIQHSSQKQQLKDEIMRQFDSLKLINSKLESKVKRLQAEKLQLKQENQHMHKKVKSLNTKLNQFDQNQDIIKHSIKHSNHENDKLKQALKTIQNHNQSLASQNQNLISQNQSLINTNQVLQNQLAKIQKELQSFHQFDSSRRNASEKVIDLENKILESDQCIKGMSSEIQNLLQQNRALRDRINEQEKAGQNKRKYVDKQLSQQLKKRDMKIRQLMGKVNILQEQLRESDKSNSSQKNRLSFKIKELQTILGNRNWLTSPVRFS